MCQTKLAKPISKGQTVVSTRAMTSQPPPSKGPTLFTMLPDLPSNTHYCHYCSVSCNSIKQWDEHCASEKHMFNVNSDKEHQWNYRQPPWGVPNGNYELCLRSVDLCCGAWVVYCGPTVVKGIHKSRVQWHYT